MTDISSSWILDAIGADRLERDQTKASRILLKTALNLTGDTDTATDSDLKFTAEALELAVFDLLEDKKQINTLRKLSQKAFQLLRVLPIPHGVMDAAQWLLKVACIGVLADRGADACRILKDKKELLSNLPLSSEFWGERVRATIVDIYLRLIRKDGWQDLVNVQNSIIQLRSDQERFEGNYLENSDNPRVAAWELVALYHLSKAADILAMFLTQGSVDGNYDIQQQLESHFDKVLSACSQGQLIELENLSRLLIKTAQQLVDNSIWTVTRAVNSRVTAFVRNAVDNAHKPIFEMLPPQRRVLREAGLLGSAFRSVVVNLPTSSGKTFIAQFRILQALNQFERDQGWVAYLVPTRALVNQIYSRLRNDFNPLGIKVERVSPALEIDGVEAALLQDNNQETQFDILISTPEKFDLLLRGGWEEKIKRPLTLIIVDEAHNLAQEQRGIKLELLLSTINRECRYAQFLLLTPFIQNSEEIATWLDPSSNQSISLELDWLPNDRAIILNSPKKGKKRGDFSLEIKSLHTSNNTLSIPENLSMGEERPLNLKWSEVNNSPNKLAAAIAQILKGRGSQIILVQKISYTWSVANLLKLANNNDFTTSENVKIVQRFLQQEFSEEFALSELLSYGIGVHHSGLSDEARILIEWLFENNEIQTLVATTTIAQGVNFPIASVILASHQYPYGKNMSPEEFWNLAGRAGRVDQGSIGIVAFACTNENKANELRQFVNRNVEHLNSTLIQMVQDALERWGSLELHELYKQPEWSSFVQYLTHSYVQIGNYEKFVSSVEQVLRGTLGFQHLRHQNRESANKLVNSVRQYIEKNHKRPLSLVDDTGFAWESIGRTLAKLRDENITQEVWNQETLFTNNSPDLRKILNILQDIPELNKSLEEAKEGMRIKTKHIADVVTDWVNGVTIKEIAQKYFMTASKTQNQEDNLTKAITDCCKILFSKLIPSTSWGMSALQKLTYNEGEFESLSEQDQRTLRNLPAFVFYGVNSDDAITLRSLGIPRKASVPLARELEKERKISQSMSLAELRNNLKELDAEIWSQAMGQSGQDYYRIWKILEGDE